MTAKSFHCLLMSLLVTFACIGQTIRGTVVDAVSGEPLTGAIVSVTGQSELVAMTGLDGSFSLKSSIRINAIRISHVGYQATEVTVNNRAGALNVRLEPVRKEIEGVIVVGRSEEKNARGLEKKSPQITNIVSARAIEISPDITVANVIQRVSGVTIERNNTGDGQYALLRGMDKRFNYTLVNGVKIPSPDNKNRFVPLDIFPSEILERLEVNKSLLPSMEGDGIGGAINLVLKEAPDKFMLGANVATGFNSSEINQRFLLTNKNAFSPRSVYETLGSNYPARTRDFNARLFDARETGFRPNVYGGILIGNRFLRNRIGILVSGIYQHSYRGNNSTDFPFTIATSDASNLPVLTKKNDRFFSEEQSRAGLHANLDARISPFHKIQWYQALMDLRVYQVRDEQKTDLSVGYDPQGGNFNLNYDRRFRFSHQKIYTSTLKGEHSILGKSLSVDWSIVYSKASNDVPDNSSVHLVSTVRNGIENPRSVVVLGGADRRWEHNTDEDKSILLNVRYPYKTKRWSGSIDAGGLYRDKKRTNFFNQYDFRPFDESKPAGSEKNLIEGVDFTKFSEIKFSVFNPYGSTGDPLNYDASEKISAGYLQGRLNKSDLEIIGGLRVEHTNQGYFLRNAVAGLPNEGNQQYTDLLPGIHVKWMTTKKSNLRLSYYKAINRPSFFEIVPYRIINEELTEAGNPDLKHTVAHNLDMRYELFPGGASQLLLGVFYKKIINPIEFGMVLQGQGSFYMPGNFGNAKNYGVELDFTRYIHYFGIKANYTYTNSKITSSKLLYYPNPDPAAPNQVLLKNVDQSRRLAGQAAHVANLTLLYKNSKKGIDAQLSFTYTGDRLYAISRYVNNDLWQSGFIQSDLSAEKKISAQLTIFMKATNVLNTPVKLYLKKSNAANSNVQGYENYRGGTMVREDRYGQTILAGVRFKF